jgi:hypothetical protein
MRREDNSNKKFCAECMRWMNTKGGKDKISKDKLRLRWQCVKCVEENNGKEISNKR